MLLPERLVLLAPLLITLERVPDNVRTIAGPADEARLAMLRLRVNHIVQRHSPLSLWFDAYYIINLTPLLTTYTRLAICATFPSELFETPKGAQRCAGLSWLL